MSINTVHKGDDDDDDDDDKRLSNMSVNQQLSARTMM